MSAQGSPVASLLFLLVLLIFWIGGSIVVAANRSKKCSFAGTFVISLFFSPLIGLLINILEELKSRPQDSGE